MVSIGLVLSMSAEAVQVKEDNAAKSQARKNRRYRRPPTQRREELDSIKRRYTTTKIDDETFRLLLKPSDPDFAFPISVLPIDLKLPRHYPHGPEAIGITLASDEVPRGHALNVEQAFDTYEGTLRERFDRLDKELEGLLSKPPQKTITIVKRVVKSVPKTQSPPDAAPTVPGSPGQAESSPDSSSEGMDDQSDSDATSESDSEPDIRFASDDEEEESTTLAKPEQKGTEIVLPNIEMENIALLEAVSLNILVKCGRCKHMHPFSNLIPGPYGGESKPRTEPCETCGLGLMAAFRKEYVHSMCSTLGFLDISGGTVGDLQPSTYLPTCGQCSEPGPLFKHPDFGRKITQNCRNCHAKLTLFIDLFRFDVLSTDTLGEAKVVGRPGSTDKVHLTKGTPLPKYGACRHYRKSMRWFRFSCCKRVFPCDRCHDEEMNHIADAASRMVCGACSREQNFTDECKFCGANYTIRRTRFWEGGKGARDRKTLSRKDPHKYKRSTSLAPTTEKSKVKFLGKSHKVAHS